MLETVYILLRQKTVTAKELAGRFEVSQRTIYRDVDALSLAGIPVYTEKGKGGGISLLPEFVLSKSILSEQEQYEILSALQGLSNVKTAATDQVLQKLTVVFNKTADNWLEIDLTDWFSSNRQLFTGFKTAIHERRIAEFDYYSTIGEMTQRRIEPIQLWFKSKAWYVKGFCLTRQDMRLFKLSRIKNLIIAQERYAARALVNADEADAAGTGASPVTGMGKSANAISTDQKNNNAREIIEDEQSQYPVINEIDTDSNEIDAKYGAKSGYIVDLELRIDKTMAYRMYDDFGGHAVEKLPDGDFIVRVSWPEDGWVYGMLLSYGGYIEVLSPAHVRDNIRDIAKEIYEKY